jgi:hypothetical protein
MNNVRDLIKATIRNPIMQDMMLQAVDKLPEDPYERLVGLNSLYAIVRDETLVELGFLPA